MRMELQARRKMRTPKLVLQVSFSRPVLYLARAHPRPRPRSPCGAASEHTGRGSNLRPPKEDPKLSVCLASASSKSQKENQNTAKGTNTKRLNGHTEREMSSEAGPN